MRMNKVVCRPVARTKRQDILEGAVACFMEQGYAATSMDNVAARAGVSKATIYAHFTSKEDLFSAVIIGRCESQFYDQDSWPGEQMGARETLTQVAQVLLSFLLSFDTLAIHRVVVAEAIRQPELATAFWKAGPGRVVPRIAEIFVGLDRRKLLTVPDPTAAALSFASLLKSELFFCRLLGLPEGTETMSFEKTVAAAVNTMLKAYAPA